MRERTCAHLCPSLQISASDVVDAATMAHAAGHLIVQLEPIENIYARKQDMGCLKNVTPEIKHSIHFTCL